VTPQEKRWFWLFVFVAACVLYAHHHALGALQEQIWQLREQIARDSGRT
jgi:hypothetical protein